MEQINIKNYLREGHNSIIIENIDYIGGVGPINAYGEIKLMNNALIQLKTDKSWLGRRSQNEQWRRTKSFGRPPRATGGLYYPDFENNLHSMERDYVAILNTIISLFPRKLFWLIIIFAKILYRFGLIE